VQQVWQGRVECRFTAIRVQPVAGFAEVAVAALSVFSIEVAGEVTIREIDLAFN
jgi:hypothetical protein